MKDQVISERFNNLDRRLSSVEQILPTLATKEDLKAFATKEDLKAFATKEDLKAFATKEDLEQMGATLRGEIRDAEVRSRRHMDVIGESLRGDIQLIAENLAALMSRRSGG
ncbi:MAG TPA: hypothetical protein VN628_03470 [Vicinamibacterales bacterium]|nr:hypothetical protein [Vicinamibacterales bacterium]